MPLVFSSQGKGRPIQVVDLMAKYGSYSVGRWAREPDGGRPDRCYFCPLADIRPAVGFVVRDGWRYGYCEKHKPKGGRQ